MKDIWFPPLHRRPRSTSGGWLLLQPALLYAAVVFAFLLPFAIVCPIYCSALYSPFIELLVRGAGAASTRQR